MDSSITTFEMPLDQDTALIEAATRTIDILQELKPRLKNLDHQEARRYLEESPLYRQLAHTLQEAPVEDESPRPAEALPEPVRQLNQRQQVIEQRAKTLQQTVVLFPTFLANRSLARFKFSAVLALWKHQSRLSTSNAPCVEKQSNSHRFDKRTIGILTESFKASPTPSQKELAMLRNTTKLTEKQISMWFTNRRCRSKRAKTTLPVEPACRIQDSDCSRSEAGTWSPSVSLATPPLAATEPQSIPQRMINFQYSSEDDFFINSRQEAEVEFYQTMFGQSGQYDWFGFGSYSFTGGR